MTSYRFRFTVLFFLLVQLFALVAMAQQNSQPAPRARITAPIDERRLVTLAGNTHPLARAKFDNGVLPDSTTVHRMFLLLSRSPEQETALQQFLDDQQTPGSPHFRQWLTPEEFGAKFGPADADLQAVTSWLASQGFLVNHVSSGKTVVEFSGNVAQLRQAFHTQMHQYSVAGKLHFANATDPQIPAALAPVVKGITSLNNFARKPASHQFGVFYRDPTTGEVKPDYTVYNGSGTRYYAIGPADFATIYNTNPLQTAGITGTGQTIAVIGDSNINLQDITDFRNLFGLGAGNTSVVIDGTDPGINGDEVEALLDTEWANATAPGASVVLVSAQGTEANLGTDIAALYAVENNLAGVISLSFGYCEQDLGNTENQFIQSLWQQASAQGITVVVSAGDNGSAGCDDFTTATQATHGLSVSGLASTPFNVAAGGTDFNDVSNGSLYWNSTSTPGTLQSAKSYIPEIAWNSSCAAGATAGNLNVCPPLPATGTPPASLNILAGSGGPSSCSSSTGSGSSLVCHGTPKPAWQTGAGVPNDGLRDIPDISLFSAINSNTHTFYLVCAADALQGYPSCQHNGGNIYFLSAGGTSVAAPTFAGIIALAEQKAATRLGNVNYLLYSLAAQPGASCTSGNGVTSACIYNDVVQGNNSVPCAAGSPNCSVTSASATGVLVDSNGKPAYSTQTGYDLATGLGSVNGANLVNAIAKAVSGFTRSTTTLTLNGATSQVTAKHGDPISVAVNVTPTAATGSVALLGSKGDIDQNPLSGGLANWSSRLFPGGNYSVTAHYAGDGTRGASDSNGVPVSISPEASQTFVNLVTFDLNTNAPVSYSATNVPYGSPYILRMDVTDATGKVNSTTGVSSNCSNHLTSCPTGTLTLTANGVSLDRGIFPLNNTGLAEDAAIQLTPGTYSVTATYPGDASYNASSGTNTFIITKAPTTLKAGITGAGPYTYGTLTQIYGDIATNSSGVAPTGTVTFLDNGRPIPPCCTNNQGFNASSSGPAHLDVSDRAGFTPVGSHALTAQYSGDANYAASTSAPFNFTVLQATPTVGGSNISPSSSTPLVPVTLSFALLGTATAPTGAVVFTDNGTPITGTVTYGGSYNVLAASLTSTFTQLGTHTIAATYPGDANYTSASQTIGTLNVVAKLPTSISSPNISLNPALLNYPIQFNASVTPNFYDNLPAPTGTVTFLDNGTAIGTPSLTAAGFTLGASLNYTFTTTGTHTITIQYGGDSIYLPSQSQAVSLSVDSTLPSKMVGPSLTAGGPAVVNQPAILYIQVFGNSNGPNIGGGTVTFLDGGSALTGPVTVDPWGSYFSASITSTFTTTGPHMITAQYSGDTNYSAVTSQPATITVEGPLWVNLYSSNQSTVSSSGGLLNIPVAIDNNTSSSGNITLTCSSDSIKAPCTVGSPNLTIAAHSSSYSSVTANLPANTGALQHPPSLWTRTSGLMLCGVFMGAGLLGRRRRKALLIIPAVFLIVALMSCGGGGGGSTGNTGGGNTGGGGGGSTTPPAPVTYHFTITANDGNGNTSSQVYTATVQ